jgi:hypothetical protein
LGTARSVAQRGLPCGPDPALPVMSTLIKPTLDQLLCN